MLLRKKSNDRRCNIYTTNHDGCVELSAENILSQGGKTIAINDGASGFKKRYFHTNNYNN